MSNRSQLAAPAASSLEEHSAAGGIIPVVGRVLVLTALLLLARLLFSSIVGLFELSSAGADSLPQLLGLLAGCFLYSVVLSYVAVRSRWSGLRLALLIFWLVLGITVVLAQVESVVFLQYLVSILSPEMLTLIIVQSTLFAVCCGVLVPLVHGKLLDAPPARGVGSSGLLKSMGLGEWAWKLAAIAILYVVIYISAGMFIFRALAGPAFDEYYHGLQMPAWILPFQMVRAMIWVLVAVPILQSMEGKKWEAALATALSFSLLMSAFLLGPNAIMPDRIRLSHFVELTASNFVFGWIVAWLLSRGSDKPEAALHSGAARL